MSVPKTVLWKAADGKEFIIDTDKEGIDTMEGLYEHIAMLREKHGYMKPHAMSVVPLQKGTLDRYDFGGVDTSELPDYLRKAVEDKVKEDISKPDPRKLN